MKSIRVNHPGGLENLVVAEHDIPQPKAGEVLVEWHATSLNYHDYLVAIGAIPVEENRIPMSDGAGEIVDVGEGVNKWKSGDKVMSLFFPDWHTGTPTLENSRRISGESSDGFITEYSCVSAEALTSIPDGYSFGEAATLPCAALTAWRALIVEGALKPGDKVLIEGTGGMSLFALQIAIASGARVFATTSSPEKEQRLRSMGVEGVVNYQQDPKWGKSIYTLSEGGVQHVLDVGGGSTMSQSIEAAAINGKIYAIGILSGGRKGEITFPKIFFKHLTMTGLAVGSRTMQEDMVRALNLWDWNPQIDCSFGFDELADAFRYQESGQHVGKIILEW